MGHQDQLPAGAGDGNIQTPIVKHEAGAAGTDEREDHDIALASLESFDCVDRNACAGEHLAKQNNLGAERGHYPDRLGINGGIARQRSDQIDNHSRFVDIGPAGVMAFNWNKNHGHAIGRFSIALADAGFEPAVIEKTIRDLHNLRMHPVLRLEQRDIWSVALEPLEHRMRKTSRANHGRKLAVISNQYETARAENQAERERFGKLPGLINDRHFEGARAQVWNR